MGRSKEGRCIPAGMQIKACSFYDGHLPSSSSSFGLLSSLSLSLSVCVCVCSVVRRQRVKKNYAKWRVCGCACPPYSLRIAPFPFSFSSHSFLHTRVESTKPSCLQSGRVPAEENGKEGEGKEVGTDGYTRESQGLIFGVGVRTEFCIPSRVTCRKEGREVDWGNGSASLLFPMQSLFPIPSARVERNFRSSLLCP